MSEPMQVGTEENIRLIGKIKQVGAPSPTVPLTVKYKFGYWSYYVILCNAVRRRQKTNTLPFCLLLLTSTLAQSYSHAKGNFWSHWEYDVSPA
jgi:hypothetical protein